MQLFSHSSKNTHSRGFTILEVIVSLVIVGISITAFIRLLGNSTMFRSKLNEHDERHLIAITKAEETFLGLLDGADARSGDKSVIQGTMESSNIDWHVEKVMDETPEDEMGNNSEEGGKAAYFYTVTVDGIEISSVTLK